MSISADTIKELIDNKQWLSLLNELRSAKKELQTTRNQLETNAIHLHLIPAAKSICNNIVEAVTEPLIDSQYVDADGDEIYDSISALGYMTAQPTSDTLTKELKKKIIEEMELISSPAKAEKQESVTNQGILTKKQLITQLNNYKDARDNKTTEQYFSGLGFLSRAFGAWSKNEKFEAVDALIDSINTGAKLDPTHLGPLKQGNLGDLVKSLNIKLNDYVTVNQTISF